MTSAAEPVLETMRRRRVTRAFLDEPVPVEDLRRILLAARWSSTAGGRHIHRFLVIRDPERIQRLRPFAPGNPLAPTVMAPMPFKWWFRPVRSVERVGEHSAVVCHCE